MKKSYERGVATHIGPESCGAARKGGVEALTGERAGRVDGLKLLRKLLVFRVRFSWLQGAATKCAFLHQREKHRHKNQHVNR
jgi:hypothetical protein